MSFICVDCQRCEDYNLYWDADNNFEAHVKCFLVPERIYFYDKNLSCPNFIHKACNPVGHMIRNQFIKVWEFRV